MRIKRYSHCFILYVHPKCIMYIRLNISLRRILYISLFQVCLRTAYKYSIPPLFVFCIISMIVNVKVTACVYWIRRPLSSTLLISLSLAVADACTSLLCGVALFLNSYLICVHSFEIPTSLAVIFEIGRLSGLLVTVAHLFALSGNHYLGILKPLHYHSSMINTRKVTITIILLWTCPIVFVTCYLLLVGYKYNNKFSYRLTFASLFFIPLIIMSFFYVHILIRVRKQQRVWSQFSRNGSTRWKAVKTSSRNNVNQAQQQRQVEGNIRAIKTTLLILGSCVLGWMPAVLAYSIMCQDGCPISGKRLEEIWENHKVLLHIFMWLKTFFLILKSLINPIIYTIRMTEIQVLATDFKIIRKYSEYL